MSASTVTGVSYLTRLRLKHPGLDPSCSAAAEHDGPAASPEYQTVVHLTLQQTSTCSNTDVPQ